MYNNSWLSPAFVQNEIKTNTVIQFKLYWSSWHVWIRVQKQLTFNWQHIYFLQEICTSDLISHQKGGCCFNELEQIGGFVNSKLSSTGKKTDWPNTRTARTVVASHKSDYYVFVVLFCKMLILLLHVSLLRQRFKKGYKSVVL